MNIASIGIIDLFIFLIKLVIASGLVSVVSFIAFVLFIIFIELVKGIIQGAKEF